MANRNNKTTGRAVSRRGMIRAIARWSTELRVFGTTWTAREVDEIYEMEDDDHVRNCYENRRTQIAAHRAAARRA